MTIRLQGCLGLVLMLALCGCAAEKGRVTGVVTQDALGINMQGVVALSADEVVLLMRRAGFTDEQVLDLGPDLRNALATQGAGEIHINNNVEAIFAVDDQRLYVSSRRRGSFIYPLREPVPATQPDR